MPLINRRQVKAYLLDEAKRIGKKRLERVSGSALQWLEKELTKRMDWLVSLQPHGGPKTIRPPN